TVYLNPGNSHTSRQASAQLQYGMLTGDTSYYTSSVRQLIWATYMVNDDGRNRYPNDENWLTDGYGDYVRHYLLSMSAAPELAPDDNHIISSTSVVQQPIYKAAFYKYHYLPFKDTGNVILYYRVFDSSGEEMVRLPKKPSGVLFNNSNPGAGEIYEWKPLSKGGVLIIKRKESREITILQ
ncbi:MAG: hypothetical protein ABJA90_03935, partial [Ginsengibacter sp.]